MKFWKAFIKKTKKDNNISLIKDWAMKTNLKVSIFIHEQILRLNVAVVYTPRMTKCNGRYQLLKVLPSNILRKPPLCDLIKQLASFDELHDDIYLWLGRHDLVQLHDVRVADAPEDLDFSL